MLVYLIAVLFSAAVYGGLILLLGGRGSTEMKGRFEKYFNIAHVDDVQDLVLKERKKNKKNATRQVEFVSRELSNYIAASGIHLSGGEYIGFWLLSVLLPLMGAMLLTRNLITAVAAGIIGFSLPPILVQRARKRREEMFNKQLGESLTVIVNCLKAGFSFQQAMESIASEMPSPISTEFSKTLREVQYGASFEDALKHMNERVKNRDLDLLVSSVLTARQVGGNLSDILEVIADTIQDRIKIKTNIRVLTASGRISGLIIGMLPVAVILLVMMVNPSYFSSFFASTLGRIMIGLSIVMEVTGFLIIGKIVNIEY